jgi:hypothetical protein
MGVETQGRIHGVILHSAEFDYDDVTAAVIDIPAETYVEWVKIIITTAFDGSASMTVGDSADADIWIESDDITEATAGVYQGNGGNATYYTGHWYATATQLKITYSASEATAGAAILIAKCLSLADLV